MRTPEGGDPSPKQIKERKALPAAEDEGQRSGEARRACGALGAGGASAPGSWHLSKARTGQAAARGGRVQGEEPAQRLPRGAWHVRGPAPWRGGGAPGGAGVPVGALSSPLTRHLPEPRLSVVTSPRKKPSGTRPDGVMLPPGTRGLDPGHLPWHCSSCQGECLQA